MPCFLQGKTSLLAWTVAGGTPCCSFSVCLPSSTGPQYYLASNTSGNWNSSYVSVVELTQTGILMSWKVLNLIILAASTMISCSGRDGWQLGSSFSIAPQLYKHYKFYITVTAYAYRIARKFLIQLSIRDFTFTDSDSITIITRLKKH